MTLVCPPPQPALPGTSMPVADVAPAPGTDHGEVFTRRWVVELILDLVGYTSDQDLGARTLVEPSCGTGAFLVPVVDRLVASSRRHRRRLSSLGPAIRALDLLDANAQHARKAIVQRLTTAAMAEDDAARLAAEWVATGDFLRTDQAAAGADHVVGNPPYIRVENVPRPVMDHYRRAYPTMRGRADIYVGFFERGLGLLKPGGTLSFVCADRWMHNQYGARLRELITASYAVETVISMHDVDAFEDDVSAYPAIVVLGNAPQSTTAVVETASTFGAGDARRLSAWVRGGHRRPRTSTGYEAARADRWFQGRDLWPAGSPSRLALLLDIESRFPPLQDPRTGTRVGIGVATGCDDVFITTDPDRVEGDRLLPLLRAPDTTAGTVAWSGTYLVNPWDEHGLVELDRFPRLADYLHRHRRRLRTRHIARQRPGQWHRTIDRVHPALVHQPKLVLPDMKAAAHPVLDPGAHYPHHNLYYVVSRGWDPEVLGGLLLSDVANAFVGAYCVKMRGGTYRFQAQYVRRIRVPELDAVDRASARALADAFTARDRERATGVAARLYGIDAAALT